VGAIAAIALTAGVLNAPDAVAKSTKTTVGVAKVPGVGVVLVDSTGKTLYTLTNAGAAVDCTGQCPTFWPPYMVKAGTKPKAAKGVKHLGVSATNQVTVNGLPLYRFMGDMKKGQANGEGINSFGGTWHVQKVSSSSSSSGTKSSSSGGYGY
jgi:predicted lipoprotein with Yx(FWY)xxD motif